jgi:hypothetical protein
MDETFLIMGRINWNRKEQKIETFQWWISVKRFKILAYGEWNGKIGISSDKIGVLIIIHLLLISTESETF